MDSITETNKLSKLPPFIDRKTALVQNLPKSFNKLKVENFLRIFNPTKIKMIGTTTAFCTFDCELKAVKFIHFLHQQTVEGNVLHVKFAKVTKETQEDAESLTILPSQQCAGPPEPPSVSTNSQQMIQENFNKYLLKLYGSEQNKIFDQPPPPHLKYSYPKVNRDILDAISITLTTCNKFYTQVLHLMNRMNLEPPFMPSLKNLQLPVELCDAQSQTEKDFGIQKSVQYNMPNDILETSCLKFIANASNPDDLLASDESEIESSPPPSPSVQLNNSNKRKHNIKQLLEPDKKRIKSLLTNFQTKPKSISSKPNSNLIASAFDTSSTKFVGQSSIKIKADTLSLDTIKQRSNDVEVTVINSKSDTEVVPTDSSITLESSKTENIILSDSDLLNNQIPHQQLKEHPLFQNYECGARSNKLYIKNLAKSVTDSDLECIYKRFSKNIDIKLMQTGRMKGQAFITFNDAYLDEDNFELVNLALLKTNGFVFKDKVMIVMFGKKK